MNEEVGNPFPRQKMIGEREIPKSSVLLNCDFEAFDVTALTIYPINPE